MDENKVITCSRTVIDTRYYILTGYGLTMTCETLEQKVIRVALARYISYCDQMHDTKESRCAREMQEVFLQKSLTPAVIKAKLYYLKNKSAVKF